MKPSLTETPPLGVGGSLSPIGVTVIPRTVLWCGIHKSLLWGESNITKEILGVKGDFKPRNPASFIQDSDRQSLSAISKKSRAKEVKRPNADPAGGS